MSEQDFTLSKEHSLNLVAVAAELATQGQHREAYAILAPAMNMMSPDIRNQAFAVLRWASECFEDDNELDEDRSMYEFMRRSHWDKMNALLNAEGFRSKTRESHIKSSPKILDPADPDIQLIKERLMRS